MSHREVPSSFGSRTDVGRVRPHNEDSLVVMPPLFAVADGMGGHEAGEVASEIAIEALVAQAPAQLDSRALGRAVIAANRAVIRAASNGIGKPGMGTTMTAAMLDGTRLVLAHVGDSRAYLLHDGFLQRITRDHSLMADYIDEGRITEAEARVHPQRSIITRALGSDPQMVPDIYELNVCEGDKLMLCSDGLSGMIEDSDIEAILNRPLRPQSVADALVTAANMAGGHDNVTVIVVEVTGSTHEEEIVRARKSRTIVTAFIAAFVLILALAGFGLYSFAHNSAYLIANEGYVAVYRGFPGDALGLRLSWLEQQTDIAVSDLPTSTAARLTDGVRLNSIDEASGLLASYREEAAQKTGGLLGNISTNNANNTARSTGGATNTSNASTSNTNTTNTNTAR